jgi:hypothetical protein
MLNGGALHTVVGNVTKEKTEDQPANEPTNLNEPKVALTIQFMCNNTELAETNLQTCLLLRCFCLFSHQRSKSPQRDID